MILAESENYIICSEYETAYLISKTDGEKICIADMYGDPAGAYIPEDEKYCVVFGCGVVLCRLFDKQLTEFLTDSGIWFTKVLYADDSRIILRSEDKINYTIDLAACKISRDK